ncbi:helix-turn-helix transcriptional regulator [Streptomyces sp. A3M-1-3]|uniref:helix-turn-helix transcriptional regulator n=1 Tax=Streptomyces sp. A3M-1-3 TaxID=2962044 RepID=UPI0020B8439A|nr:helix-turn-helix transcriptional regulator [Streptomyces sp. A3M-1-3]MCP3820772.1 helix-turn-helix transcriptional regulator [Streptomyces sp. A3M-1-3]
MTTTHTRGEAGTASGLRREALRDFLRTRRARVTPEDVGLPGGGRRRTPGLRREEVATLAGIGVTWYTWLEQGRGINVSDSMVASISRVLMLDETERTHLYRLAGLNPPQHAQEEPARPAPELERLLEAWMPRPAYVLDRWWNFVLINHSAKLVFGLSGEDDNCLVSFFTNTTYRARFTHWDDMAPSVVANFRSTAAAYSHDEQFAEITERLAAQSPEFADLWARHDVRHEALGIKSVTHPVVGRLDFEHTVFNLADRQDLRITLHLPQNGALAEAKIGRLLAHASPSDRAALRRVPSAG